MQEVDSYIQEMHKELSKFVEKKRSAEQENINKLNDACNDIE